MGRRTQAPTATLELELPAGLPELPLQTVAVTGKVTGMYGQFEMVQIYANQSTTSVNAIYTCPLPDAATVLGCTVTFGSTTVTATLKEKQAARQEYETARDGGHYAALVEQHRPDVFQMSVANIEPGKVVTVRLIWFQSIPWQGQGGRLTVPLVVAPRFIPGRRLERPAQGGGWSPDTDVVPDASLITPVTADTVSYTATVSLTLTPGFPATLTSPSHEKLVPTQTLAEGESTTICLTKLRPDRDVIVSYETTEALPTVSVERSVVQRDGQSDEHYALVQVVPGSVTAVTQRQVVLLLDVSGSMRGSKIAGLRRVCAAILKRLESDDTTPTTVAILAFDDRVDALVPTLTPIGPTHFAAINQLVDRGGTQTGRALTAAMACFSADVPLGVERSILLVTDGQSEDKYFETTPGVRVHAIGIDTTVAMTLLAQVVAQTGGVCETIVPGEDFAELTDRMVGYLSGPVLRHLHVALTDRATSVEKLLANGDVVGVSDLFAARPTTIAIRLGPLTAEGARSEITLTGQSVDGTSWSRLLVTGVDDDGSYWWLQTLPLPETVVIYRSVVSPFAAHLWAKLRLRTLAKPTERLALSLASGVLCGETAFVAVSRKETPSDPAETIELPVLMPAGWEMGNDTGFAVMTLGARSLNCRTLGPETLGPTRRITTDNGQTTPTTPSTRQSEVIRRFEELSQLIMSSSDDQQNSKDELRRLLDAEVATNFAGWDELGKAALYLSLVQLRAYGFKPDIPAALSTEPTNVDARRLWVKAQQALGHATV